MVTPRTTRPGKRPDDRARPGRPVTESEVRAWAVQEKFPVGARGKLPSAVIEAWNKRHQTRQFDAGHYYGRKVA